MSLNSREIAERFLSLYTVKNQSELARRLGVTPSAVSDWKKGRSAVPWEKLIQVIEESGVSWDWLLEGKGSILPQAASLGTANNTAATQNIVRQILEVQGTLGRIAVLLLAKQSAGMDIDVGRLQATLAKLPSVVEEALSAAQ